MAWPVGSLPSISTPACKTTEGLKTHTCSVEYEKPLEFEDEGMCGEHYPPTEQPEQLELSGDIPTDEEPDYERPTDEEPVGGKPTDEHSGKTVRARSKVHFAHWLRKTLRSLTRARKHAPFQARTAEDPPKFTFPYVKVVKEVPLITQNKHHDFVKDGRVEKADHSCWAYARAIALYRYNKGKDYSTKQLTPWQLAEEIFWERINSFKSNSFKGDHWFISDPKKQICEDSINPANPEEIPQKTKNVMCQIISKLVADKVVITGLGACGDTEHYSNIVGFTSKWENVKFTSPLCKDSKYLQLVQTEANNIFAHPCIFEKYCEKQINGQKGDAWEKVQRVAKDFHFIIAEPWCDKMTSDKPIGKEDFIKKHAVHDCRTGETDGKDGIYIKEGDRGSCPWKDMEITEWKCLREVPFLPVDKTGSTKKNCKEKWVIKFSSEDKNKRNKKNGMGRDFLRSATPCVLFDPAGENISTYWGYIQFMWAV